MKMKRLVWGFLTIAVVALLAGCGGGGGTSLMVGGERATQDAIDALQAEADAAGGALTSVRTTLGLQEGDDLGMAIGALQDRASDGDTAMDTLTNVRDQLDIGPEDDIMMAITALGGVDPDLSMVRSELGLMSDASVADIETKIGELNTAVDNGNTAMGTLTNIRTAVDATLGDDATDDLVADVTKLADAYIAALDQAARDQMTLDSNLAQGLLAAMVTQGADVTVTATNTDGAVTVLVNPDATTNLSDFGPSTRDVAPDAAGFTKVIVEKAPGTDSVEIAAVYTDVQPDAPKSLLLDERASGSTDPFFPVVEANFATNATTKSLDDTTAPDIGETVLLLGALEDIPGTNPVVQQLRFGGSWRGVDGTFVCQGCTAIDKQITAKISKNAEGETQRMFEFADTSDVWTFEPTDPNATVNVADADYLWFGWWQDMPTTTDGTGDQGFRTFAGGLQPFDTSGSDAVQAITGNATYEGSAAGKYVQQAGTVFEPTYIADAFTATARLTAQFGADNEDGTIAGTITGFKDSAGQALTGWAVEMQSITLQSDNAIFGSSDGNAVATIGSINSTSGDWNGAFFGNGRTDGQPGSAAGRFRADFGTHTSIAGAYGAHNTSPDTTN